MYYQTMISADELKAIINDDNVRVFDCRFNLKDPQGGINNFNAGHLPNAQHADMDTQLSSAMTETSGRHPLPDPEVFLEQIRQWGITNDTQVIAYDDMSGAFAARLWWMMRWCGHDKVAVLNGGMSKWTDQGYELSQETVSFPVSEFNGQANMEWLVDIDTVATQMEAKAITLIDARSSDRFTGKDQNTDPVPGHIPGATSLPFPGNLNADGVMASPEVIRTRFEEAIKEQPFNNVVNMCGSGVTACHNLLAQAVAGLPPMKIFIGSWSQWTRDKSRSVATGE